MARTHRRRRRRTFSRRRRRNPAFSVARGLPVPNIMDALTAAGGGIASKMVARMVVPQATGWLAPLATLGAGIGIAFVLKTVKMGGLAKPVALGAAVAAATDAIKMTPLGAQLGLGYYVAPGDVTPVLDAGVGFFPPGFSDPSLAAGNGNYPSGFEPSFDDIY